MRMLLVALAVAGALTRAAHAETCYTNCYWLGDQQYCTTQCYDF